jgi:hypothetical protein
MSLTVVQVAFPFAPVSADAVGGAEQIVAELDAELVRMGHRSVVVACAGSSVQGELVATPLPEGEIDDARRGAVQAAHRANLARAVRAADVVHLHGLDFGAYLPPPGLPALVTLHLPPGWYPPEALRPSRPDLWLNPVSWSQHRACPPHPHLLPPVCNGVPVEALATRLSRRRYALALGRICPEKNLHVALDAGTRAGIPVLLGGQVFPYPEHQRYWREEIAPRLASGRHRFLGPLGFMRKRRLLGAARCLVSASIAPETSSLVAMEALACGTPVVALGVGALPEIVEHGVTGFIAADVAGLAEGMRAAARINAETCRATACRRFSATAMANHYLELYGHLLRESRLHAAMA